MAIRHPLERLRIRDSASRPINQPALSLPLSPSLYTRLLLILLLSLVSTHPPTLDQCASQALRRRHIADLTRERRGIIILPNPQSSMSIHPPPNSCGAWLTSPPQTHLLSVKLQTSKMTRGRQGKQRAEPSVPDLVHTPTSKPSAAALRTPVGQVIDAYIVTTEGPSSLSVPPGQTAERALLESSLIPPGQKSAFSAYLAGGGVVASRTADKPLFQRTQTAQVCYGRPLAYIRGLADNPRSMMRSSRQWNRS